MSLLTRDYDYPLPEALIARHPPARREDARMMVLHRAEERIEHRAFVDLPEFVRPGDLLVLNNTRVVPARHFSDDGKIELLLLEKLAPARWKCLVKPGRKMRVGSATEVGGVRAQVEKILPEGERVITFASEIDPGARGVLPLPPYLQRASEPADADRYQTVFASESGALAAPTAGLHFTPEILARLPHVFVTLHVGTGTFRPVQTECLSDHRMHTENFSVSPEAAAAINAAGRVIAIGTTTARVLEGAQWGAGKLPAQTGATRIFIHPPQRLRHVDVLLTNFHLPRSTLLMLVSALAGREFILRAYAEAVRERYRFYSYGDCMLIL